MKVTSESLLKQIDSEDMEKFNNTFRSKGVLLTYFTDKTFILINKWVFDLMEFDKWLHKIGYDEIEHGSMKDYLSKEFSSETASFIDSLITKYPKM